MQSQRFGISKPPSRESGQKPAQNSLDEFEDEQTHNEQLAFVAEDEAFDSNGEECELDVYETRLNTRGEFVCLRAGTEVDFKPLKRRSHRACLVLDRNYNTNGEHSCTKLEIQSRHIINALREVIVTYPGVNFTSKSVTIHEPPRCLFHYRNELREYAESSNSEKLKSHMQLCLQYIEKTLHYEIKLLKSIKINHLRALELEHRHLWVIFKPGCLIYQKAYTSDWSLMRLLSISGKKDDKNQI